jgi:predicted acetyltransferase
MRLVLLRAHHLAALRDMAREFRAEGDDRFRAVLDHPAGYVAAAWQDEIRLGLTPPRVGQAHHLLFDGRRLIGGSRLRYRLSPLLLREGGNIGYEIRRSQRGQGYGHAILRLTLDEARRIGLRRILLTVAEGNSASLRVIESAGGELDGSGISPMTGEVTRRFWIEL